jgi:hypothetical protein
MIVKLYVRWVPLLIVNYKYDLVLLKLFIYEALHLLPLC